MVLGTEPLVDLVVEGLVVEAVVGRGEDLRREDCREEGVRTGAEGVLGVVAVEEAG